MAFTVTGLDGWAIPDLRIAGVQPAEDARATAASHRRMAGRQAGWPVA